MGFQDDPRDGLSDASESKHISLLENIGVLETSDVMHNYDCGRRCHRCREFDKIGIINRTEWWLAGGM